MAEGILILNLLVIVVMNIIEDDRWQLGLVLISIDDIDKGTIETSDKEAQA